MVGPLLICHELLSAERTRISSVIKVSSFMSVSDVSSGKSLATNGAQKCPLLVMSMAFPRVLSSEGHPAILAFVWSDSRMDTLQFHDFFSPSSR